MFINPITAINEGWIKGIKDPQKQVQPNAIDFTLDEVRWLDSKTPAKITESMKQMRDCPVFATDELGMWTLSGGQVYDGTSEIYVEVPEGVAAILYTRSSFTRNGIFITSGLYDSGFKGQIGFTIYTIGGNLIVAPGTRIGQIAFVKSDSAGVYAGGWNHKQGTHYSEDKATPKAAIPNPESAITKTMIEPPIGQPQVISDRAAELQGTHRWSSDNSNNTAGKKTFI